MFNTNQVRDLVADIFKSNKSNQLFFNRTVPLINAIVFFKELIKNGDRVLLTDLKITIAILQKNADNNADK